MHTDNNHASSAPIIIVNIIEDYEYPRTLQVFHTSTSLSSNCMVLKSPSLVPPQAKHHHCCCDPFYHHIMKATLQHNAFHRFVAARIFWLPVAMQLLIKSVWPRYTLPSCFFFLKKLRKPEHTEAFENEQAMYRRLAAVQDDLLPHYYGEADCEGDRTSVISLFPYPTVLDQPLPRLAVEVFRDRIKAAVEELFQRGGVVYDDSKLNNIMVADNDRLVFVDLEFVDEPEPSKASTRQKLAALEFVEQYRYFLKAKADEEKYSFGYGAC